MKRLSSSKRLMYFNLLNAERDNNNNNNYNNFFNYNCFSNTYNNSINNNTGSRTKYYLRIILVAIVIACGVRMNLLGSYYDIPSTRLQSMTVITQSGLSFVSDGVTSSLSSGNDTSSSIVVVVPVITTMATSIQRKWKDSFIRSIVDADVIHVIDQVQEQFDWQETKQEVVESTTSNEQKYQFYLPLDQLITENNSTGIIGDVSNLLDFAILGHAKCATSYLMEWLNQHEEVQIWDYEVCDLYNRQPAKLVRKLYNDFIIPSATTTTATTTIHDNNDTTNGTREGIMARKYQRGFKCPGHFSMQTIRYFQKYFPNTALIIGVRNPITWFESYYNFRYRHPSQRGIRMNMTLPSPHELMKDNCPIEAQGVCLRHANFHQNLAKFGKTNWNENPIERQLLNFSTDEEMKIQASLHKSTIRNKIFLFDVAQLYDTTNHQRKEQFKYDLQQFLSLSKPLVDAPNRYISTQIKHKQINICDDQYTTVRNELLEIGTRSSQWINTFFVPLHNNTNDNDNNNNNNNSNTRQQDNVNINYTYNNNVVISGPNYFEQIVNTWHYDPCVTNITDMLQQQSS